jgi:hypothetical protein
LRQVLRQSDRGSHGCSRLQGTSQSRSSAQREAAGLKEDGRCVGDQEVGREEFGLSSQGAYLRREPPGLYLYREDSVWLGTEGRPLPQMWHRASVPLLPRQNMPSPSEYSRMRRCLGDTTETTRCLLAAVETECRPQCLRMSGGGCQGPPMEMAAVVDLHHLCRDWEWTLSRD